MESVNRNNYFLYAGFSVFISVLMASCASVEDKSSRPSVEAVKLESRASLLNWHDVSHKSYYGLKGPVKELVIKPAAVSGNSSTQVSDEWQLQFNPQGRLISKRKTSGGGEYKSLYKYTEKRQLKLVSSYDGDTLWRTSLFEYDNGKLVKISYSDRKTREQMTTKIVRQPVENGWFDVELMITVPGLPTYSQFTADGALVWSSRGDINNGLGEQFYLRTVDGVTSSSVDNKETAKMTGRGGYRYLYSKAGQLKAVESYNAHANRLFHVTRYNYDDLGLLKTETRNVKDTSPFNEAIDESVKYEYLVIDAHGNWTSRKLKYSSRFQSQEFLEDRVITYY